MQQFPTGGQKLNFVSDKSKAESERERVECEREIDWHVWQRLAVIAGESCRERIRIHNLACVDFN